MRLTTPDVVWLLVVTWAGRTYRFATQDVEIDGLPYAGTLTLERYSESVALLDAESGSAEATVSAMWPVAVTSIDAWLRSGTAELSQWVQGLTYSQRSIRVRGGIRQPAYGTVDEPVSFLISPDGSEDRAQWPPAAAVVDLVTFPTGVDQGKPYPFVYGKPAHSPAVILATDNSEESMVIAGHPVTATTVKQINVDEFGVKTSNDRTTSTITDGLGRRVTACQGKNLSTAASTYIDWSGSTGGLAPSGGMGDAVIALLEESTVTWDRFAWQSAKDELNAYTVAFYLDRSDSPWQVAKGALLSLAPVSVKSGADGVYPVLWRIGSTAAIAHIKQADNAWREGGLVEDDGGLANAFRMTYRTDQNGQSLLTAAIDSTDTHQSVVSFQEFGTQAAEPIESRVVDSAPTATRALLWRSEAYAFPWRSMTYSTSDAGLASLVIGDVVTVTDSDFSLSSVYAHVVGVEWSAGAVLVTVTVIHRP